MKISLLNSFSHPKAIANYFQSLKTLIGDENCENQENVKQKQKKCWKGREKMKNNSKTIRKENNIHRSNGEMTTNTMKLTTFFAFTLLSHLLDSHSKRELDSKQQHQQEKEFPPHPKLFIILFIVLN